MFAPWSTGSVFPNQARLGFQTPPHTHTSVINSGRYLVFGGIHFSITIRPCSGQIGEILLAKKLTVRKQTSTSWRPLLSILSKICSLSWLALLRQGKKKKKKKRLPGQGWKLPSPTHSRPELKCSRESHHFCEKKPPWPSNLSHQRILR